MTDLITSPLRASRHLAAWLVWHSMRVSLVSDERETETA